jgi:hypothetical protein
MSSSNIVRVRGSIVVASLQSSYGGPGAIRSPQLLVENSCHACDVTHHADVNRAMSADGVRLDIHLCHRGPVTDEFAVSHGPHVQGASPADDEISVRNQLGCQRSAESP